MTERAENKLPNKTKSTKSKNAYAVGSGTQSYQAAYERLSQIAMELEDGQVDLDRALPLLTEAQAAYAVCQERIGRLQALLDNGGVAPLPLEQEQEAED